MHSSWMESWHSIRYANQIPPKIDKEQRIIFKELGMMLQLCIVDIQTLQNIWSKYKIVIVNYKVQIKSMHTQSDHELQNIFYCY